MPQNQGCQECRLQFYCKHKCLWGNGTAANTGIFLIGEAPNKAEDAAGVFLADSMLDSCLQEAGLQRSDVYVSSLIKCRPPNGNFDVAIEYDSPRKCAHYLQEELDEQKPKLIVLMGNKALEHVVGYKQVEKYRGKLLTPRKGTKDNPGLNIGDAQLLATIHPNYAHRSPEKRDMLVSDLSVAARMMGYGTEPDLPVHKPSYLFLGYSRLDLELALNTLSGCSSIAIDLEWTAPKKEDTKIGWPWSRIDCGKCDICKANKKNKNAGRQECLTPKITEMLAISFSGELPDGAIGSVAIAWPAVEPDWLIPTLNKFLANKLTIYHNAIADGIWSLWKGILFRPWHDTMALTYNEDEEEVRSLEVVATKVAKILPAFKHTGAIFKSREVVDWNILLERVAADTYATFVLLPKIKDKIGDLPPTISSQYRDDEYEWESRALEIDQREQVKRLYLNLTMPMIPIVTKMCVHGMPINIAKMDEAIVTQTDELYKVTHKLASDLMMPDDWAPLNTEETWKLLNWPPNLVNYLNRRFDLKLPDTNKTTLSQYQDDFPTLSDIRDYRHIRMKLLGTYLRPWRKMLEGQDGPIGTLHSLYGLWARTGRLSAKSEEGGSAHTIPHEDWLRALVEAPEGYKLVIADNSIIELRVLAWLSGDEHMLELFRQGIDIHQAVAAYVMYALPQYHMEMDEFWPRREEFMTMVQPYDRKRAKPVNFGFAYMQQPLGFVDYARTSYGLHFTLAEAVLAHNGWMAMFPQVQDYFSRAQQWYNRQWCITPLGRIKHHALGAPEIANFPVQATASDLLSLALIDIDKEIQSGWNINDMPGLANLFASIHDSSMDICKTANAVPTSVIVQQHMERPRVENLGLNFADIPVPLKADVGIFDRWEEN